MEKKILVPVTFMKDARLGDLDVDVELEVSCNFSHEFAPAPAAPSQPEAAWGLSGRPLAGAATAEPPGELILEPSSAGEGRDLHAEGEPARDTEESTMAFDTAKTSSAVKDALGGAGRAAAGKNLPITKPAPKATGSKGEAAKGRPATDPKGKPSSKTKIDNVLDELLKKKTKK